MYNVQGKVSCMTFMDPRTLLLAVSRGLYSVPVLYTVALTISDPSCLYYTVCTWNGEQNILYTMYDTCFIQVWCVTGDIPEVHELWELRVPEKLVACEYAGLVRNRDFTLAAAGYTKASVNQVRYSSKYSSVDGLSKEWSVVT